MVTIAKIFTSFCNAIKDEQNPNAMPIFYESFIKDLKKFGNEVFAVSHSYWNKDFDKCPDNLLKTIKNF